MVRRIIITSILLAIFLGTPLAICGAEQEYHVIQTGETLYSIAKSYSIPYDMLASINGITDPSKIRPGIVLLIPQVHVVGKGETYYGISKKYDISIQELKTANNLADSYVLRVGDTLIIPEHSGTSIAVAQTPSPSVATPAQQPAAVAPAPSATSGSNSAPSSPAAVGPSNAPAVASAPKSATPTVTQSNSLQTNAPEKPQSQPTSSTPTVPSAQPAPSPTAATNANALQPSGAAQSADTKAEQDKGASRATDTLITWPVDGKGRYMSGKLEGIMFATKRGATVQAVASGTVVSAGPSRGFGQVVFVQSKSGFVYVYGGNESILVKTGDSIAPGKTIATVGVDSKDGSPTAYFFVFRNGQPVDPSLAPRE